MKGLKGSVPFIPPLFPLYSPFIPRVASPLFPFIPLYSPLFYVVPPQVSPEFVRVSELADEAGWLAVQPDTLRHVKYENVFGVGDVINAPNAKTAAAVRKQVPVVADNVMAMIAGKSLVASYNGYGACPLTVEKGKVVLAEFGYGGKLLPSLPIDCTKPSRFGWVFNRLLKFY